MASDGHRWETSRPDQSQIFPLSQLFYTLTNIWLDGKIIPQGIKNISKRICLLSVAEADVCQLTEINTRLVSVKELREDL